jgi:hypothetical protein
MSLTSIAAGNGAGGCGDFLSPVCQGYILQTPGGCANVCKNIRVRSADLTGDLLVDVSDLAQFAFWFPPNPYNKCGDFDCNTAVDLSDLARFAFHFGPPGHKCT